MQRRQGWLFPMMVVAAASTIASGALGIVAITGHLVMPPVAPAPLDQAADNLGPLASAQAYAPEHLAQRKGATSNAAAAAQTARLPAGPHGHPVVRN